MSARRRRRAAIISPLFRHSLCVNWEALANSLLHLVSGPSEIELIVRAKGLGNLAQRAATREQREIDEPLARNGQEPGLLSLNLNEREGALRVGVFSAGRPGRFVRGGFGGTLVLALCLYLGRLGGMSQPSACSHTPGVLYV
jgi:hypothetical protein